MPRTSKRGKPWSKKLPAMAAERAKTARQVSAATKLAMRVAELEIALRDLLADVDAHWATHELCDKKTCPVLRAKTVLAGRGCP